MPILAPFSNEELFVNRKNSHYINIQAIFDNDSNLLMLCPNSQVALTMLIFGYSLASINRLPLEMRMRANRRQITR